MDRLPTLLIVLGLLAAGCIRTDPATREIQRLARVARSGVSLKLRSDACQALGEFRDSAAVRMAVRVLSELIDDESLNWAAAFSLGKLGDPAAIPVLRRHVISPSGRLNRATVQALVELRDTASLDGLREVRRLVRTEYQADSSTLEEAIQRLSGP